MLLQVIRLFCKKYLPVIAPPLSLNKEEIPHCKLVLQDRSKYISADIYKKTFALKRPFTVHILSGYDEKTRIFRNLDLLQVVNVIAEISGHQATASGRLLGWLTNLDGLPRLNPVWRRWDPSRSFMFKQNVLSSVAKSCRIPQQQVRIAKVIQHYIQDRYELDLPYYDTHNNVVPNAWIKEGTGNQKFEVEEMSDYTKGDICNFVMISYHTPESRRDISDMTLSERSYYHTCRKLLQYIMTKKTKSLYYVDSNFKKAFMRWFT